MNRRVSYEDEDGEIFAIEIDYNLKGYSVHQFKKMRLTPAAAKELADELLEMVAWSNHSLYKWAVKKMENKT